MAKKKDNTLLYAGIAAAAILLLKKKDTGMAGVGASISNLVKRAYWDARGQRFDYTKNFYELRYSDIAELDKLRREYKYSGRNSLGREPVRQFYYQLQEYDRIVNS
jgi:hypothetical protein